MERSDLEKMTPEQRAALPKGKRMYLAELDKRGEAEGLGREIERLTLSTGLSAAQVHDMLIDGNPVEIAMAMVAGASSRVSAGAPAPDTSQAPTTPADTDVSVRARRMEDEADALEVYGNELPEGVSTEAFAAASNLRHAAAKLRQTLSLASPREVATGHTADVEDERCTYRTLSPEMADSMRRYGVRCYLKAGHLGAHRGWHAEIRGELSWIVNRVESGV